MAFLLGFYLESAIGLFGFWFLEVHSLLFIYMLISFFLSGQMFPLDLLDSFTIAGSITWGDVVRATPLEFLAYFPAAIFVRKVEGSELLYGLLGELVWAAIFLLGARWLYLRGLRRYSAYGG